MSFTIKKFGVLFLILISIVFLAACTESVNVTINFDSNGGSIVSAITTNVSSSITIPPDPEKEGYSFGGWYWDNETFNDPFTANSLLNGPVSSSITVYAEWSAINYSVTFNPGLGTIDTTQLNITYGEYVNLPNPVISEYIFLGWYFEDTLIESGTWNVAGNITLFARYAKENVKIYYNYGYDSLEAMDMTSYGSKYSFLQLERKGYEFNGWIDENGNKYGQDLIINLEEDIYLTAEWEPLLFRVSLDLNGGTSDIHDLTLTVEFDTVFSLPVPVSGNGPFNGWYLNNFKITDNLGNSLNKYNETTDITLTAMYFYEISTIQELLSIDNNLIGTYKLMNDIDISGVEWNPIGNKNNPFSGKFNGQDFIISGLTITNTHDYAGLFGYSTGEIKNLKLENVNINFIGNINQIIYGASLVGYNEGLLENIETISGQVSFKVRGGVNGYLGGIAGYIQPVSILKNLKNNLDVIGDLTTATGGLLGYSENSITIISSYNNGLIEGVNEVGGLIGHSYMSTIIISSYNNGSISGVDGVGGLLGGRGWIGDDELVITESYNTGEVTGNSSVGGLIGRTFNSTISESFNMGLVNGLSKIGGLIGFSSAGYESRITSSYNTGSINGSVEVGGLVGSGNLKISNSYNAGTINGGQTTGGLIGQSASLTISNSYNIADISGFDKVGGLVGYYEIYYNIEIINSYNTGSISGKDYIGGILGYGRESINSIISNSYNTGSILGRNYVGGLLGRVTNIKLSNSFNSGAVEGNILVGGIIGAAGGNVYLYSIINLGNIYFGNNDPTTVYAGGILGTSLIPTDYDNAYYSCFIYSNNQLIDIISFGNKVDDISIFTEKFFIETMLWEEGSNVLITVLTYLRDYISA